MLRKIIFPLLITLIIVMAGAGGLSIVAAQPGQPPGQPPSAATPTPEATEEVRAEPVLSIEEDPETAEEIDPDALILGDGWQFPVNLSQSGATTGPQLVIDGSGKWHVLWSDKVDGFGYTVQSGETWSQPVAAEFPFFTRRYYPDLRNEEPTPSFRPVLVADGIGQIHAFWISDRGVLYTSSVPADSFTDYESWTPRTAFSDGVLKIAATKGPDGRLHLAYIRSEESETRPAGVYYQHLDDSGIWIEPTFLYESRYLRTVPIDKANLQVLAKDDGHVYAVWDNPLREQIIFAGSSNDGLSWDTIQEIDRRGLGDGVNAKGPANILLGTHNDQLFLTWNAGHEREQTCSQYLSVSGDGGATWTYRETPSSLPRCFMTAQYVVADNTLFLMGTSEQEGSTKDVVISTTYLLAWDGERWSEPQIQEALTSFSNPETNQIVQLQCHKITGQGSELMLLGCDSGSGGDIWRIGRGAGDIEEWFPPPPVWQGPDEVSRASSMPLEPQMVTTIDGIIHAFWNEANSKAIYHNSWDGNVWSSGQQIATSPEGDVATLAVASGGGQLFMAWQDAVRGIQFSTASISSPTQWSEPVSVAGEQPEASSPSIVADSGGNVFLAFAIQLNETRGVYLLHSADAGETWSAPIQVFDGPTAGWDMVDKPLLTQTDNGQMHLMWTRRSFPPDSVPLELAYSRSEDLGQSWSEAETVVEGQSYWNALVGSGERFVHRLWSEESQTRNGIWHRFSMDGGLTWGQSEQLIGLSSGDALATAVDPALRLHLLTLQSGQLGDLVWEEGDWTNSDGLDTVLAEGGNLSAAANQDGELMVIFAGNRSGESIEESESRLFALWRTLELPADLPEPLPTLTPTPPAATPEPTVTPEPTATIFFSTEQEQTGLGEIPGMRGLPITMDLIIAFIPVLLILGLGVLIGLRVIRKR